MPWLHWSLQAAPILLRRLMQVACKYGPTIAVYRHNAADPDRIANLERDFLQFLTAWNRADAPGRTLYEAEYLLVTARKR